jgi:predicted Zn-dependent protease
MMLCSNSAADLQQPLLQDFRHRNCHCLHHCSVNCSSPCWNCAAGHPELALQAVREALSAAPEEVAVLQLASELSAAAGLPSAALELREQLLQRDARGRLKHLADLMTLTQQMGLHERAAEHAQNLLQTAPDDPAMLTAAAEVLAECGRSELAATALEAALKRQPDAPATALALASLLAEQGQTSRALDVCRSALEHTTENRSRNELARLLAELYQQLGSPSDVLQWLESRTAEADDTARGGWLRTLTEVHKSSGQTTLARRTLERCLQLDGPDPAVLLELSELALQQRDPQSAVSSLQQILRRRTGSHRLSSNAGPRTPRRICREQSAEDGGHPATARNQRSRRSPRSAPAAAKIQRSKRGCRRRCAVPGGTVGNCRFVWPPR